MKVTHVYILALTTLYEEDYIYIHQNFVYHFPFDSFCQVKIEVIYCFYKAKIICRNRAINILFLGNNTYNIDVILKYVISASVIQRVTYNHRLNPGLKDD